MRFFVCGYIYSKKKIILLTIGAIVDIMIMVHLHNKSERGIVCFVLIAVIN